MKVSVIVCTHNRCESLRETLQSLVSQKYPSLDYEVIVVDNCSTDRTKEVVSEFSRVRYVREEKIGLSYARNRGIMESRGDIIAFIDDDARAEDSWVSSMQSVYDKNNDAMCVGGKIILEWSSPKPSWWSNEMDSHLSAVDYGDKLKKLSYPLYPYGTNISFRRSVFNTIGMFNPELGRKGKKLLAGEEIDVCLNIEKMGGIIYYNPDMVVYHMAQPERLSQKFIVKKSYWHGRSSALIEIEYLGKRKVLRRVIFMLRQIIALFKNGSKDINSLNMIYSHLGYIQQVCLSIWNPFRLRDQGK